MVTYTSSLCANYCLQAVNEGARTFQAARTRVLAGRNPAGGQSRLPLSSERKYLAKWPPAHRCFIHGHESTWRVEYQHSRIRVRGTYAVVESRCRILA